MKSNLILISVLIIAYRLVLEPEQATELVEPVSESVIHLSELRKLSHRCWWKDYLCCQNVLQQCRICTDMCLPGTYTKGVYATGTGCCCGTGECTKDPKQGSGGLFDCALKKPGAPSSISTVTKKFTRNTGPAVSVILNHEFLFTSPNPTLCGEYECTNLVYKSGVDQLACMTTINTQNDGKTFDTDTCTLYGSTGVYEYICEAKPAFKVTFDNVIIIFYDFCGLSPPVGQTHPLMSFQEHLSGARTSPITNFFTNSNPDCKMASCSIVDSTSTTCGMTAPAFFTASVDASGTTVSYNVDTTNLITQAYYCLRCLSNENTPKTFDSNPFKMEVICGPTSNVVTNHGSLAKTVTHQVNGITPVFPIYAFSNDQPLCPIQQVEIFATDKATSPVPNMAPFLWTTFPFTYTMNTNVPILVIFVYYFNIRVTLEGGQIYWANLGGDEVFVLNITCPAGPPWIDFVQNPAFITSKQLYISATNIDVYEIKPPVTSGAGNCPAIKYEVIELEKNSFPHTTAMIRAISCNGDVKCPMLDSLVLDHVMVITFKIRITIQGGLTKDSTLVQIDVLCNIFSAVFAPNLSKRDFTLYQYESGTVYFNPFACTPGACCMGMKYTVSKINTSFQLSPYATSTPVLVTDAASPNYGELSVDLYTGELMTYSFYIMVENDWGTQAFSQIVTVQVLYNCKFCKMWHKTDPLFSGDMPDYVLWQDLNRGYKYNSTVAGAWLIANYTIQHTYHTDRKFSLKERILTNATEFCPITDYVIQEVLDIPFKKILSRHQTDSQMTMTKDAVIDLFGIQNVVKYYVWVTVWNSKVWLTHPMPALQVNTSQPLGRLPNFPPFFDTAFQGHHTINVTKLRDEGINYLITLPKVLDGNEGDTWTIKLEPNMPWIRYVPDKGIVFNVTYFEDSFLGNQFFTVTLQDANGGKTKMQLKLTLFVDEWKASASDDAEEGFISEKEAVDWEYKGGENVTAYIHSISVFGLMEVRFNASMFDQYNLTLLNNRSMLDLYIVPERLDADLNISRLNFTWEIVYFEDKVMRVQLNFTDPTAISPHIEQDRICLHLFNVSRPLFFSDELNNQHLHFNSWTLYKKVRKQLDFKWRPYMEAAEFVTKMVYWMFLFCFILQLLPIGGNFRYYMWYMRSLQLVVHIPMFYIVVPANVCRYLELVMPIITFDMFRPEWSTMWMFNFDFESQRKFEDGLLDQMEDLGYKTHNSLLILGSIWIYFMAYLSLAIGYQILKYLKAKAKNLKLMRESIAQGSNSNILPEQIPNFRKRQSILRGAFGLEGGEDEVDLEQEPLETQSNLQDKKETLSVKQFDWDNYNTNSHLKHPQTQSKENWDQNPNLSLQFKSQKGRDLYSSLQTKYDAILSSFGKGKQGKEELKVDENYDSIKNFETHTSEAIKSLEEQQKKAIINKDSVMKNITFGLSSEKGNEKSLEGEGPQVSCCCTWKDVKKKFKSTKFSFLKALRRSLFFGMIIAIVFETYLEWMIAGVFNTKKMTTLNAGDRFGNVFSYFCVILSCVWVPCILFYVLYNPKHRFYSKSFLKRLGYFFYDLRRRKRIHLNYWAILTGRRLIFLLLAFGCSHNPTFQVQTMLFMNIGMTIYIGTRPMETRWLNFMHFLEEVVIEACCVLILAFTNVDMDEETRLIYGWLMILVMSIHFLIVCIWISLVTFDFMKILNTKWGAVWRVWAVRKFGFRIGSNLKNYFNLKTGERVAPQLMMMVENKDTGDVNQRIMGQIDREDPKNEALVKMMNHLPHMIEKTKANPALLFLQSQNKQEAIPEVVSSLEESRNGPISSRKQDKSPKKKFMPITVTMVDEDSRVTPHLENHKMRVEESFDEETDGKTTANKINERSYYTIEEEKIGKNDRNPIMINEHPSHISDRKSISDDEEKQPYKPFFSDQNNWNSKPLESQNDWNSKPLESQKSLPISDPQNEIGAGSISSYLSGVFNERYVITPITGPRKLIQTPPQDEETLKYKKQMKELKKSFKK